MSKRIKVPIHEQGKGTPQVLIKTQLHKLTRKSTMKKLHENKIYLRSYGMLKAAEKEGAGEEMNLFEHLKAYTSWKELLFLLQWSNFQMQIFFLSNDPS